MGNKTGLNAKVFVKPKPRKCDKNAHQGREQKMKGGCFCGLKIKRLIEIQ